MKRYVVLCVDHIGGRTFEEFSKGKNDTEKQTNNNELTSYSVETRSYNMSFGHSSRWSVVTEFFRNRNKYVGHNHWHQSQRLKIT